MERNGPGFSLRREKKKTRSDWQRKQKQVGGNTNTGSTADGWVHCPGADDQPNLSLWYASPGSLGGTRSNLHCCSDPWAWWPALRCGACTLQWSCHMAQTPTLGCSHVTQWTVAFYDSRCTPCRNSPGRQKMKGYSAQMMCHDGVQMKCQNKLQTMWHHVLDKY